MGAFKNFGLVLGMVFLILFVFLVNSLTFLWGIEVISLINALVVVLFFAFGYYLLFKPDRKPRR